MSLRARALTGALEELRNRPDDTALQERYLKAFPQNYEDFLALFEPDRELHDGREFIEILPSLAARNDADVGRLLINLSKEAHWSADAPSYLQHATATYGGQHTRTFAKLINRLPSKERSNLIFFLADVENHGGYPEYQAIISRLATLDESRLAGEFEVARRKRSKHHHR